MDWAPVIQLDPDSGEETGQLEVVGSTNVKWSRNSKVHRTFHMEQPVLAAVFAHYAHSDPEELWVVIVLEDQTVHSYASKSGELKIMGLNLSPKSALSCGNTGVVFTNLVGGHLCLNIMEGPEELLQAVVPSSIMEPLKADDELVFVDEHIAVVWSSGSRLVKTFTVKLLQHRHIFGGSLPDSNQEGFDNYFPPYTSPFSSLAPSESRAAIISPLREWSQEAVGRVFTQELVEDSSGSRNWLVAVHDPTDLTLFVLSGMDLIFHENVKHVSPIRGISGVPLTVLAVDESLQLRSLFFLYSSDLSIPVPRNSGIITGIDSENDKNWVDLQFVEDSMSEEAEDSTSRVALYDDVDLEILKCFDIIRESVGAQEMFNLLRVFLMQIPDCQSNWQSFRLAFSKNLLNFSPEIASQIIFQLHLLREELCLFESECPAKRELRLIISGLVQDWPIEWRNLYPSDADGVGIPRIMIKPIRFVESLINHFDRSVGAPLPEIPGLDHFYPLMCGLSRVFLVASTNVWSHSVALKVKELLISEGIIRNLDNLNFSIQACILQILQLVDWDMPKETSSGNDKITERPERSPTAHQLFSKDLRYDEAQRCLQTKDPQQCAYGTIVNSERYTAGEIMIAQTKWSQKLGSRALATAYGRAALHMGETTLLLWDQITAPSIDFSGVCMETGISIPFVYKTLSEAAKLEPWGVFAHGTSLGLSVSESAPGIDSLWLMTSAKIKAENEDLFSGLVFGMGLSGHLKSLKHWQFYETLVNTDKYGTLAALLGLAASKLGSCDTGITKIFSVHIRALLPKSVSGQHFVSPDIEHGALVALGLLYFGTGVRHISDKIRQPLETANDVTEHVINGNNMEHNEAYKYALGMCLGFVNCGRGSANNLESLLGNTMSPHDESVESHEQVNGTVVAILCSFIGTNNANVANQLNHHTQNSLDVEYAAPATFFGRALAMHLILWDSVGKTSQWLHQQCSSFGAKNEMASIAEPHVSDRDILHYFYWKSGVLTAMAMRYTGTGNEEVINTICQEIEQVFLPLYIGNIYCLFRTHTLDQYARADTENKPDCYHVDHTRSLLVQSLAQMVGHLVLAVSAIAAGTGNLRIMRLLRQLWQIDVEFQAFATMSNPEFTEADLRHAVEISSSKYGLDLTLIAESFGWLFMSHGERSFKTDHASIALLTCSSFVQILGGPNIDIEQWRHVRFFWSLVTEKRCLYASHDPGERVQIEIVMKNGPSHLTKMPVLLPPFADIEQVLIRDEKYMSLDLTNLSEETISNGIRLTLRANHSMGLNTMLERAIKSRNLFGSSKNLLGDVLEDMARHPQSYQDQMELALLLSFYRHVRPNGNLSSVFSDQWLEQTQLKYWLSQQA